MEQLRSGGGDGQGRRRRRRSHQPVKVAKQRRTMLIAGGVLLLGLAVGGWFGFRWISKMRIESEAFRLALGRTVSRLSGVTVAFERVSEGGGGSLSVEAIHVQPGPGMLAESAEFRDASALLTKSSWVGSEWGVTSVLMREGKVRFNPVRAALPADSVDLVPLPVGGGVGEGGMRMGISPEPSLIAVDRGRVASLGLAWAGPGGMEEGFRGMDLAFKPLATGGWEASAARGELVLSGFPSSEVVSLNGTLKGREVTITGGRLGLPGGAVAAISGKAVLAPDGGVELDVSTAEVPIKYFLLPGWNDHLAGSLRIPTAKWSAAFGEGAPRALEGEFVVRAGVLRGLPFVNKIALALGRRDLTLMEFNAVRGHFKWTAAGLELTDVAADRDGALRMRGGLTVAASGEVAGKLVLEVSELLLPRSGPDGGPSVFPPVRNGVSTIGFSLGGKAGALTDTFPAAPGEGGALEVERPEAVPGGERPGTESGTGGERPRPVPQPQAVPPTPEALEKEFRELIGK